MFATCLNPIASAIVLGALCICVPELVSILSGLLDVVMALEPEDVACVALAAAAASAAKFCMAFRPKEMQAQRQEYIKTFTQHCMFMRGPESLSTISLRHEKTKTIAAS